MADFTNPGILGTIDNFRKTFQSPILNGREPDADEKTREKGQLAQVSQVLQEINGHVFSAIIHVINHFFWQANLSTIANRFILRRTNELLSKVTPSKLLRFVFNLFWNV
jgi:DNA repair and recombination RAD54-like protein